MTIKEELLMGHAMFLLDMDRDVILEDSDLINGEDVELFGDVEVSLEALRDMDDYFYYGSNAGRM